MNILIKTNRGVGDAVIPATRLQYSKEAKVFAKTTPASGNLFVKGPIPLDWISAAASLPGKCLNVAISIQWLAGMCDGKPFKLTAKALRSLHVSDDTARDCLRRMERAGLLQVERKPGQRPVIQIRDISQGGAHGQT